MKKYIFAVVGVLVILTLGGAFWLVQSKLGTKFQKTLLKATGGSFTKLPPESP